MNGKLLAIAISIAISTTGVVNNVFARIEERDSKNFYSKLDSDWTGSCSNRVTEYICTLPAPNLYNITAGKYKEKYRDFYELSQDIF